MKQEDLEKSRVKDTPTFLQKNSEGRKMLSKSGLYMHRNRGNLLQILSACYIKIVLNILSCGKMKSERNFPLLLMEITMLTVIIKTVIMTSSH